MAQEVVDLQTAVTALKALAEAWKAKAASGIAAADITPITQAINDFIAANPVV